MSQEFVVASGVPKGLVFDPILLICHISDIDAQLQSTTVRPFADVTRLIKKNRERKLLSKTTRRSCKKI